MVAMARTGKRGRVVVENKVSLHELVHLNRMKCEGQPPINVPKGEQTHLWRSLDELAALVVQHRGRVPREQLGCERIHEHDSTANEPEAIRLVDPIGRLPRGALARQTRVA